jgi:hypothetical protein
MIPVPAFLDHMERGIQMVREAAGGDLSRRGERDLIAPRADGAMGLLMTLNF